MNKLKIILFVCIFCLSSCKTKDGYYLVNHCGGASKMSGCEEWVHESQMTEKQKLNAMSITERMLYTAKKERKNKKKKSNTTAMKKNIGLREIAVCRDSPINISEYKNTWSFKWDGLPEWDNCFGVLIEDNVRDIALKRNPNRYEGEWTNGEKTGLGKIYACNDGFFPYLDVYHRNDYTRKYNIEKRQYTFEESGCHVYVGMVDKGSAHGKGIFYDINGNIQIGEWKYNEFMSGKSYTKEEFDTLSRPGETEILSLFAENKSINNLSKEKALKTKEGHKKINKKPQNEAIPEIIVTSSIVDKKKGIVQGKIINSKNLAEFTINNNETNHEAGGSFIYSTFIPRGGIEIIMKGIDFKGRIIKKTIYLERNKTEQTKTLNFAKLNPLKIKGKKNKNALALVIGISKYNYAPEAKYADRDANYFYDFTENILGISSNNIKLISNNDANLVTIKQALKIWLKGYSVPNKSNIYIFFAGHGLASTDGKELYLLPHDGDARLLEDTALLRSEIFATIKSINPKSVTVFLDACYSGQTREKDIILTDARPITIVPLDTDVPENFTVFSASSGSEISSSLPEAAHGLFSYFLMKGLEGDADTNNDRKITTGELHSYVRSNVTKHAIRLGREQTPQLQGDINKVLVEFY